MAGVNPVKRKESMGLGEMAQLAKTAYDFKKGMDSTDAPKSAPTGNFSQDVPVQEQPDLSSGQETTKHFNASAMSRRLGYV